MTRRTWLAVLAVPLLGLVAGAGALAWAHGGGGRQGVMKRVVAAMLDDALDRAQVTPEQRAQIHAVRDRVWAAVDAHRQARGTRLEDALALFEADRVDPARLDALRRAREEDHQRIAATLEQAIVEVHGLLTPAQRRALADQVREHHRRHAR
jgi:uncharacterized membrane protein